MKHGLTLTSLMVAVALSGVLAVAGTRLVVNQMNTMRVLELKDKGDSIFEFYSNLLHDDKVWWCTLYDRALETSVDGDEPNYNRPLRRCVLRGEECTSGTAMRLMGPDCRFLEQAGPPGEPHYEKLVQRFNAFGAWQLTPLRGVESFKSSAVTFIPVDGKDLKDSATQEVSGGWWNVKVTWEHKGNSAVDIIFTQKFDQDKWRNASVSKRYLPKLDYPRILKVRRSANQAYELPRSDPLDSPHDYAIIGIELHTANRTVRRHGTKVVNTNHNHMERSLAYCHDSPWGEGLTDEERERRRLEDQERYRREGLKGGVVQSNVACSAQASGRVAVTPKDCGGQHSVIAQIGAGTASDNVKCALDGKGKMVLYNQNCGSFVKRDSCTVTGGNPTPQTFTSRSSGRVPAAIAYITNSGGQRCVGLSRWPATTQGGSGIKGRDGSGRRGPPGPAWNQTCR